MLEEIGNLILEENVCCKVVQEGVTKLVTPLICANTRSLVLSDFDGPGHVMDGFLLHQLQDAIRH